MSSELDDLLEIGAKDAEEGAESSAAAQDTGTVSRVVVGLLLIVGGLVGQCAGGKVPDNPSLLTLMTAVVCVVAAVLAFGRKAIKSLVVLSLLALVMTILTTIAGPGHWSFDGVWVFDIGAIALIGFAVLWIAFSTGDSSATFDVSDKRQTAHCRSCGRDSPVPQSTPSLGTAYVCASCHASLLPVGDPGEQPYLSAQQVEILTGYRGRSLIHPRCPACREVNYSVFVPANGYRAAWYSNRKQENPEAALTVDVTCVHCGESFVIEWDVDPS